MFVCEAQVRRYIFMVLIFAAPGGQQLWAGPKVLDGVAVTLPARNTDDVWFALRESVSPLYDTPV